MLSNWKKVHLGEVAQEVTVGFVGSMASEYVTSGVPFLRSLNVQPHRITSQDIRYVSPGFHSRISKSALAPGDVVTVRTGKPGATAVIPEWLSAANCSDLVVTRPGRDLDARWLSYYINGVADSYVSSRLVGAVQQHFNVGAAKELILNLPPLEEQRGIAATLGALDDKIDSNRRSTELLEQYARLRFQQLFKTEHYPEGIPVSVLVDINRQYKLAKDTPATYVGMSSLPEFYPVVTEWETKAVGSGQKFVNGDVLMARITPCLENGKTAVADMLDEGEVGWGSTEYVVLSPKGEIRTPWIYCFVRDEKVRAWAIRRMTGSSGRQRFAAGGFQEYRISEPDSVALETFNRTTIPIFERITEYRNESKKLAALRDVLLPELLSGRIRVPEAQEMVLEASRV